jgi:hypothetical protein
MTDSPNDENEDSDSSGRKALDTDRHDTDRTMTETDDSELTRNEWIDRQRELQHVAEVKVDVPEDVWRFIATEWCDGEGVPDPNGPEVADALSTMVTFEFDWQVPDLALEGEG